MNIVYVIEDFSENGGVERIVSMKASLLASRYGHQVSLISVYHDERLEKYLLDERVKLYHLDVPFAKKTCGKVAIMLSRIRTLYLAVKRLNRLVDQLHPDAIFFATTLGVLLLPFCRTKAKKIFESHSSRLFTPYHKFFWLSEHSADAVVCLTKDDAQQYKHAKKVWVISNFISLPDKHVVNYGIKRTIAVGRLEYAKGFDLLIDMWTEIAKQCPDWQLDIYGEGSQHAILQKQIDDSRLNKQIKLCGRSERIMDVYPDYSLHVMPSRYEGQPMVMIEAQACGLPSVAFDFQYGARDIIQDGVNGILVPQGDKNAFVEAVVRMMQSEQQRQSMGQVAQKMSEQYSQEHIFGQWLKLLADK